MILQVCFECHIIEVKQDILNCIRVLLQYSITALTSVNNLVSPLHETPNTKGKHLHFLPTEVVEIVAGVSFFLTEVASEEQGLCVKQPEACLGCGLKKRAGSKKWAEG